MMKKIIFCSVILLTFFTRPARTQELDGPSPIEKGSPLIRNYSAKEYLAAPQINAIVQDSRGIIYIANISSSLVEFDGVRWRHIEIPGGSFASSLASDEQGRVYVGAFRDFGYLAPNAYGTLQFQSLLEKLKPEDRDFRTVSTVFSTPQGVYYSAGSHVFCLKDSLLQVWKAKTSFSRAFYVDQSLFLYQLRIGLVKITGDSLQLVAGGEQFANRPVEAMFPYPGGKDRSPGRNTMLLALAGEGLFLFNDKSLIPLNCETSKFIQKARIRSGTSLGDSLFALGTDKGAVIFNIRGEILQVINKKAGLANEMVFSITPDREGGLWLATLQGVARVNSIRPVFTVFNENAGIDGVVSREIARHQGILYIRTTTGIHYLNNRESHFYPVAGLAQANWNLFQNDGTLFAIRNSLRRIDFGTSTLLKPLKELVVYILPSKIDPGKVYLQTKNDGFRVLQHEAGDWLVSEPITGINGGVVSIAEKAGGDLWLSLDSGDFIRFRSTPGRKQPMMQRFEAKHGLSEGCKYVYPTSAYPVFTGPKGIFRFDEASQRFFPDTTFGRQLADGSRGVNQIVEDKKGNLWMTVLEGGIQYLNVSRRQQNGRYIHERKPFLRLPSTGIWSLFPEENGIVWFGGEEGLFRYDDNVYKNYNVDYPALIRRVIVNPGEAAGDSVIFNDTGNEGNIELIYANNALRFEFAATSFELPSANRYRFFLEDFEDDWSDWTNEIHKDYTNIPEGTYTFRVRAKNVYEHLSSEGRFSFKILPPWHRTWWAYTMYGLLVFGAFFCILRYEKNRQNFKLRAELQHLETEKLKEMDRMKSRFFANISHEFRTPLTLILGQIDSVLPQQKQENKSKLLMVIRNARRLQAMINQLLDLSKFEAGQMTLKVSEKNIVLLLKQITGSFESLASERQIDLHFESLQENIPVFFEQDKIEKMVTNLLSNALKFTQTGGNILVKVELDPPAHAKANKEIKHEVKITVLDSGIGIAKERLPNIFDRFYQVDSTITREYEGTGIGLALTMELVQIHGGSISVDSSEGFGTSFVVNLPLGKAHLKPEQIVDVDLIPADKPKLSDIRTNLEDETSEFEVIEADKRILDKNDLELFDVFHVKQKPEKHDFVLIVEDNPDMRIYIRKILESQYRVIEAVDGEDAFTKALECIPDLIITDVMMPRVDGYELTRRIRRDQVTSHIPIIMLTAKAADEDKLEGLETGVDAYLIKPFKIKELQIRVRKLIEMRQKLRAQAQEKPMIAASEVMVTSMDKEFLRRLQEVVEENLNDEEFQVAACCKKIGLSRRQLQRKMSALLNCSPAFYIRRIRLERAKQLLEKNAGNVSQIAYDVGYGNVSAFARAFREAFGQSPSSFLK